MNLMSLVSMFSIFVCLLRLCYQAVSSFFCRAILCE